MAGVEDEEEFKDALGAADPPPSSPSPTSKPKLAAAAGGGGLGRRLLSSIPLPASLSAAIGRFSSPKPPASNVGLGLLLHAGPATPADGNGAPAPDAAWAISSPLRPPLASLQRQHGEGQVAGPDAGMGEGELGLVQAEEQVRPAAEDREKEGVAVDGCSASRDHFSFRGQEEEGEQCQGGELGPAMDGCMVQDQEVAVVEQEGATEDYCAAVVEDQSNNAAVEQCASDESRAVKDDNAVEVIEKVTEQEGAVSILDAAKDGVAVGSQEEDVVMAERGEDFISVQDQLEMVEQCTSDQLRARDDNAGQDQELIEQEEATEYYTALEAVEQCTDDGSKAVKDGNIVEEEERAVEQEGAAGVLDAAKDVDPVELQEEDVVVAEQNEDGISVHDQHKVVEQCTGDQLRTATDDIAAQDQDVVEQEGATEYYTAVEDVEQCTNDGSRAVKDGNVVEEKEKAVEQEAAVCILDAAKDCDTVESLEEDNVVVPEQNKEAISVQYQHKVVEQFSGDQLRKATNDNAAQDQDVVEQEGATEYYTAVEDVEQCTNDGSRAVKDSNVMEEKEKAVEQEAAVESQDEDAVVAEQNGDGISVRDQHKVVEQCTGEQLKASADDNAAQDQGIMEQEGATEYYTAQEAVEECTNDGSRAAKNDNIMEEKESAVKQEGAVGVLNAVKDNISVESLGDDMVVSAKGEDDISVQDQHKVVEQCTSSQLRTTMDDNTEGQEVLEQEGAIVRDTAEGQEVVEQEGAIGRDATTDDVAVEDQEKQVNQSAGYESRATKDENAVEVNEKVLDQEDVLDKHDVIKDVSGVELLEENIIVIAKQGGDVISLPEEGNVVEQYTSDHLRATTGDNAAKNQEVVEQEGAILGRIASTDGTAVDDQEKEVEQSAGDKSRATEDGNGVEDNEVDQEDVIEERGVIKDGSDVRSQEDNVVVAEEGGDVLSIQDVGNVVEQCASDQLITTMEDNAAECQEAVEQEGAIVERGAVADGTAVEVEQSAGGESTVTKDENAVEDSKKVVDQEDAIDKQGAAKDGSGVESQEMDVVVAEQGGDDIFIQDEGNVVEQCTIDQPRPTTDSYAAEDQELVEREGFVSILGAAKVDIVVESQEEDIVMAEQVEDCVSVQDQDKAVEQCTIDQMRTSTNAYTAEDQETTRENIGFSAGHPQRPGKLNCRFYISTGSCSYGSSCHFNHPQLKANLEASSFPSEQRNREVKFLELNRVGLPIREGARKCTYYMRNGTCRYGKRCCFNHPEQVLDVQLHMPTTGWDDTNLQSSPQSKKSAEHAAIDDISVGSEILPPNILRMLLPPQNVPPCKEEKEMKVKKDPDWSSASDDSDSCCSADSSDGPLCKQEHLDHPDRPECPFLQRFGNCKFASSCQYYHPKDKIPSRHHPRDNFQSRYHLRDNFQSRFRPKRDPPLAEELKVYPDRPGEPECPFFMKTGSCKFGGNCKFHHPKDLTPSMQDPASPKRVVVAKEHHPAAKITLQDHMQQQNCPERPGQPDCRYYMQFGKCKFQSACIFNHPKDRLSSGWHPAECPFYMKTGSCQFGSACEFYHPKDQCSSTGEAIDDGTGYAHDFVTKPENVLQQQEKTTYPERPGELECSHYMKHGYCKFQMSCKFHHPTDRLSNK